jgi:hypothetical protein
MIGKMNGAPEMTRKMKAVAKAFPKRVGSGMYHEGNIEMTESKRRCPVDITEDAPHPGLLRSTGTVHEPEYDGRTITVTLSYNTDYAVPVHENPDAIHPVGEWKYLESVLNESRSRMNARLAARLDLDKMKV